MEWRPIDELDLALEDHIIVLTDGRNRCFAHVNDGCIAVGGQRSFEPSHFLVLPELPGLTEPVSVVDTDEWRRGIEP